MNRESATPAKYMMAVTTISIYGEWKKHTYEELTYKSSSCFTNMNCQIMENVMSTLNSFCPISSVPYSVQVRQ